MTLNQTIKRLQQIAQSHAQIKHVYFGDPVEWVRYAHPYPCCLLAIERPVRVLQNGVTEIDFSITVADRVFQTEEDINDPAMEANSIEGQSDCLSMIHDLIALSESPEEEWYQKADPVQVELYSDIPFNEDVAAGARAEFTLQLMNVKDRCAIPLNS